MRASLQSLAALLAVLLCTDIAHADKAVLLDEEEWKAKMEAATAIQKKAMEMKAEIQFYKDNPDKFQGNEVKEAQNKQAKLFLQTGKELAELSGQTKDKNLSDLTLLRAAQNYMRAEAFITASKLFDKLSLDDATEKETRAQALYWNGLCQERMQAMDEAKRLYMAITKEYPDSKWAKYARGRLHDPVFH